MRRRSLYLVLLICSLLIASCDFVQANSIVGNEEKLKGISSGISVVSMDEKYLAPILGIQAYSRSQLKDGVPIRKNKTHPLTSGCAVLKLVRDAYASRDANDLLLAKKYLDWLADSHPDVFENNEVKIWKYNFAHGKIPSGWWSGMANAPIALAFRAGYEIFQDPRYKINSEKAMNGIIQLVENGGSSLSLTPDANWICEYAWPEVTNDNSLYVLNGSLMALLATRVMGDVTGIEKYKKAYEKSLNGYKILKYRFFRKDHKWTYYSLNPLVTEATHYAIYEIKLFDALFELTHDDFYLDDLYRRRKIFMESYPIHVSEHGKFLFSTIGYPNPYWIDLFPVTIDFIAQNKIISTKTIKNLRDGSVSLRKRGFISGDIADFTNVDSVMVTVFDGHHKVKLYENKINSPYFSYPVSAPINIEFSLTCFYDAECIDDTGSSTDFDNELSDKAENSLLGFDGNNGRKRNNYVTIKPTKKFNQDSPSHYTNNQGMIRFNLKKGINIDDNKFIAIVVNSGEKVKSLSFRVYDEKGNGSTRYYPSVSSHMDNLLLLSFIGFNDIESLDDFIHRFEISVYTSPSIGVKQDDFVLEIKNVLLLKDNLALLSLLAPEKLYLNEKLPPKKADGKSKSSWIAQ